MIIACTGVPTTGKTFVAKAIAKKIKADYLDVNTFIAKNKLIEGYDKTLNTSLVDIKKLTKKILPILKQYKKEKKSLVIDSHLSHYLPARYVDLCIVITCNLKTLKKRLQRRKYSKKKIQENMNAQIFDVCLLEALVSKHRVKVIDTSQRLKIKELMNLL